MTEKEVATLVTIIIILIVLFVLALIIFFAIRNSKYKKFVIANSEALNNLKKLNDKYDFYKIPSFDMWHSYDNEHFYNLISPYDYLTINWFLNTKKSAKQLRKH